ncbi:MAG: SGNH/GDSL hydrolase family protein [Lachnospiraceae bacterium]|nr:SGNH/GDSL hydrolase family protein [Lachnospiraceae bacterium]
MKKRVLPAIIISILITAALFFFLQAVLMPKHMSETKEGAMIREYYQNAGGNEVVFISDCEVYENFSPVTLWNEYGITSVIRGSAQQLIWQSYYLMEETFRYESPDVMVFNVLGMLYDTPKSTGDQTKQEAYNRMTLDGMRWSMSKIRSIHASMTEEEKTKGGIWNYIFPILRYHDRWNDISDEDFRYLFRRDPVTDNGYLMQVGINPVQDEYPKIPLVSYEFGKTCYDYLDKMRILCEEHNCQLVLIKAPSLSPIWYEEYEEQVEAYAEKYDLLYINFLELQDEVGLDWNTDTYDQGLHLNVYGAEKLTSYFGQILSVECHVDDKRGDAELSALWQSKTEIYQNRKAELEAKRDAE